MSSQPLADPTDLPSTSPEQTLQAVVETPRGSRNKYAYDHDLHTLVLKKVLPPGLFFPFDFGFFPSTLAPDGDPIDVLILMDEPAVPGCLVEVRLIGAILGEDRKPEGSSRNDRLLAVAETSLLYAHLHNADDLPTVTQNSLRHFFEIYPTLLAEKTYTVLSITGPETANGLLQQAQERLRANRS